jgi:hypothetical protein
MGRKNWRNDEDYERFFNLFLGILLFYLAVGYHVF